MPVCIDALAYMGMTLGGNTYLPDLPFGEVENWHMTRFGMPSGCQMT